MNTKLLNLLQQSVSEYKRDWDFSEHEQITIPQKITNRFAELIIQEAIDAIMNNSDRHRKEYFADVVRKHFLDESQLCPNCLEPSDIQQCANCLFTNTVSWVENDIN